jgi:hypothetical protein
MLLKMCIEKEEKYKQDKSKVFKIIVGQCKSSMRNKIEALAKYETLEEDDDVVGLLKEMSDLVYATDNTQYESWKMQSSLRVLINLKQGDKEALQVFANRFLKQVESTEEVWGSLIPQKLKGKDLDKVQMPGREKFLACLFLAGVDRGRYKAVIDDLNNAYVLGKVEYPKDVSGMLNLLINRRGVGGSKKQDAIRDGIGGTSLAQTGKQPTKKKCFTCKKVGHFARDCPENQGKNQGGSDNDSVGSDNRSTSWNQQGFQIEDAKPWYCNGNN